MPKISIDVPQEVLDEFEESLTEDIEKWTEAVKEHSESFDESIDKANESAKSSGIMIAYFIPEDTSEKLAIKNGEDPEELHVTLLYLGKSDQYTDDQIEAIKSKVESFCSKFAPLKGDIGGQGRFPASPSSDDMDVVIRMVDVSRLESFRELLIKELRKIDVEPVLNHGYTPHITLAYVGQDYEGECVHPESFPLTIDELTCSIGDERFTYPLNGTQVIKGVGPTQASVHVDKPLGDEEEQEDQQDQEDDEDYVKKSVGGKVIEVIKVSDDKVWVNTEDQYSTKVAVYVNPVGHVIKVGDSLWWQSGKVYWTSKNAEGSIEDEYDVILPKIGYSHSTHRPVEKAFMNDLNFSGEIVKSDRAKQLVFGWASIVEKDGKVVIDKQGDTLTEDELEKMAYDFVLESRTAGEMHERVGIGKLVESIVLTKEKQKALGINLSKSGWWVGFKVTDQDVWKKIEKGTYASFSIHGRGKREKI